MADGNRPRGVVQAVSGCDFQLCYAPGGAMTRPPDALTFRTICFYGDFMSFADVGVVLTQCNDRHTETTLLVVC